MSLLKLIVEVFKVFYGLWSIGLFIITLDTNDTEPLSSKTFLFGVFYIAIGIWLNGIKIDEES